MNEQTPFEFDRTCARLASALTAFFDGEATPAEAKTAREHLRHCAECAELWQAWTQSRSLLLSTPVPAPPSGFLLRLLSVCRLAALRQTPFRRVNAARDDDAVMAPEKVASLLGLAEFDNFRTVDLPAPRATEPHMEPQPPAFLLDAIRQATTRAGDGESCDLIYPEPIYSEVDSFAPVATSRASWWRGMPRMAASYAVPALLALMLWPGTVENETAIEASLPIPARIEKTEISSARTGATDKPRLLRALMKRVPAASKTAKPIAVAARTPKAEIRVAPVVHSERESRPDFHAASFAVESIEENRVERPERVATPRRVSRPAPVASETQPESSMHVAEAVRKETPRRVALRLPARAVRRSTPRLLTPVSFSPVAVRSHVTAVRSERPVRSERLVDSSEDVSEASDTWNDDSERAASVIESYRAAVAEDTDAIETTS